MMTFPAMRPLALLMLALIAPVLAGCGTLFTPNALDMDVSTYPPGASIFVNDVMVGTTPMTYKIDANKKGRIRFEKPGYETHEERISTTFNAISLLDIFFWPTFIVDIITGHIMKAEDITVHLTEDTGKVVTRVLDNKPVEVEMPADGVFEAVVPAPGFNPIRAAVLPIIPQRNASQDDAALITEELEQRIYEQGQYIYLLSDRTVVDKTIAELGFQTSDYTDSDAADLGKMLNIDHVIVGTFTQLESGKLSSLGVRIIEVESNVIRARQTCRGRSNIEILQKMPELTDALLHDLLKRM